MSERHPIVQTPLGREVIHLDTPVGGGGEGGTSGGPRIVVVENVSSPREPQMVRLSKPFYYFLLAILGLLILAVSFLLGRDSRRPRAEPPSVTIMAPAPSSPVVLPPLPPPKVTLAPVTVPPPRVVVTLPPPAPPKPEPETGARAPLPKQASPDDEEEVRFIPQGISGTPSADDPIALDDREEISRYLTQVERLLLKTPVWANTRVLLAALGEGRVTGNSPRITELAASLGKSRSPLGLLEVPAEARDHHLALTRLADEAAGFLNEVARAAGAKKPRLHPLRARARDFLARMAHIEEMTAFLRSSLAR